MFLHKNVALVNKMSTIMAAETRNVWSLFGRIRLFGKKFAIFSHHNTSIYGQFGYLQSGFNDVPKCPISSASKLCSEKKYEKPGFKIHKVVTADGVVEVKKKLFQQRITLIGTDSNMQVLPLPEAEKIAKRRNLKLLNISERDSKTDRPIYKLVNVAEYLSADKKRHDSKGNKEDKLLTINAKISNHDLLSKINQMLKWLQKGQTVRVTISGDAAAAENVFSVISENTKIDGRIPQKVFKGGEIRFQILQPKKANAEKGKKTASQPDESSENPLPGPIQE